MVSSPNQVEIYYANINFNYADTKECLRLEIFL